MKRRRLSVLLALVMALETISTSSVMAAQPAGEFGVDFVSFEESLIKPGDPRVANLGKKTIQGSEPAGAADTGAFFEKKSGAELTKDAEYTEGEVIVCLRKYEGELPTGGRDEWDRVLDSSVEIADVSDAFADYGDMEGATGGSEEEETVLCYAKAKGHSTAEIIDALNEKSEVVFCQPNYIYSIDSEEDPFFEEVTEEEVTEEEAMDATGDESVAATDEEEPAQDIPSGEEENDGEEKAVPDMTARQYMAGMYGARIPGWNEAEFDPDEKVVVAVMDTGVDYDHPDLKDVMWTDGEKYPALKKLGGGKYGYNAVAYTAYYEYTVEEDEQYRNKEEEEEYIARIADPKDDHLHGTHCAGIIAAKWDGAGISGVANGARVMAIKALDAEGRGGTMNMVAGFSYLLEAKKAGVNLVAINCSFNGYGLDHAADILKDELTKNGVCTAIASGNESKDSDVKLMNQSGTRQNPGVIVVDSAEATGEMSSYSNYGERNTHVFAPGTAILSTMPVGQEYPLAGISTPAKKTDDSDAADDYETEPDNLKNSGRINLTGAETAIVETVGPQGTNTHALEVKGIHRDGEKKVDAKLKMGNTLNGSKPKYLTFFARLDIEDKEGMCVINVSIPNKDGKKLQYVKSADKVWDSFNLELPENTDYSKLDIDFSLVGYSKADKTGTCSLLLDDVTFTSEALPYYYLSGTSMATPVVTGLLARAAMTFSTAEAAEKTPEGAAKLRAASVRASVRKTDAAKDYCVTEGIVDGNRLMERAVYTPVPLSLSVNAAGEAEIGGFFFGDTKGSLKVDGATAQILGWSDRLIRAELPEACLDGEAEVRVISSAGDGRNFFDIDRGLDDLAERESILNTPGEIYNAAAPLAAYNGRMYFMEQDREGRKAELVSWLPGDKQSWRIEDSDLEMQADGLAFPTAIWRDYIIYNIDGYIGVIDPLEGEDCEAGYIPLYLEEGKLVDMVNVGGDIYGLFNTDGKPGRLVCLGLKDVEDLVTHELHEVFYAAKEYNLKGEHKNGKLVKDGSNDIFVVCGEDDNTVEKVNISTGTGVPKVVSENFVPEGLKHGDMDCAGVEEGILVFSSLYDSKKKVHADISLASWSSLELKPLTKRFSHGLTAINSAAPYEGKVFLTAAESLGGDPITVTAIDMKTLEKDETDYITSRNLADNDRSFVTEDINGFRYSVSYSPYVFYTAKNHTLTGSKKGSADLRFTISGNGSEKFYVKSLKVKNGKKASADIYGKEREGLKKKPVMIPVIKAKKGALLSKQEKAQIKALNKYFKRKQNNVRFDIMMLDLSQSRAGLSGRILCKPSKDKLKSLFWEGTINGKTVKIKLTKKEVEYTLVRESLYGVLTVNAKPKGNFTGTWISSYDYRSALNK
ncbi:MAG: S8 family serine peptidase [Lachnospiraceae bacterium]|nr:S8 family serine peptidase [Lachnospiraceae bacterium]